MIPLAFLLLAAQQPPAPAIIYTCPAYSQTIASVGELYATKTFNADGSVREFAVRVTGDQPGFVRLSRPGDRVWAGFGWPGASYERLSNTVPDWSRGTLSIRFSPEASANLKRGKGENWTQYVVSRGNGSVVVSGLGDGKSVLYPSPQGMYLANDPTSAQFPSPFSIAIDDLLAWSSGVDSVTVYSLAVARRDKLHSTVSDTRRLRIIGSFTIDARALAEAVSKVRAAINVWEAGLTDYRSRCKAGPEPDDTIVIT